MSTSYSIIFLTETWLKGDIPSSTIEIPGYTLFRIDRTISRGGGICAYVRHSIKAEILENEFQLNHQLEYLFLSVKMGASVLAVGAFYRPPNANINNLITDFDTLLSYICPIFDHVIIMGDLNINFFNYNNPLSECFESYSLTQILNEPTRITEHSSTLIDPIFITDPKLISSSGTRLRTIYRTTS